MKPMRREGVERNEQERTNLSNKQFHPEARHGVKPAGEESRSPEITLHGTSLRSYRLIL